jgi:hypothetical protein
MYDPCVTGSSTEDLRRGFQGTFQDVTVLHRIIGKIINILRQKTFLLDEIK